MTVWSLQVVCVSPSARDRGNLTLAAMRTAYAHLPNSLDHIQVCYDDRDADRKMYAPTFQYADVPDPAAKDVSWEDRAYDDVMMMAAISDTQGRVLRSVVERCRPRFAANGTPGFNVGSSPAAAELTTVMTEAGIVEDASSALTLTLKEQQVYLDLLPPCAKHVALESRVAFALTARGKTDDGAGSYGRQFRDGTGKPTVRPKEWYVRLAKAFAAKLALAGGEGPAAAAKLQALAKALEHADMDRLASEGKVISETRDALGALLCVCEPHMTADLVATLKAHAEDLAPVLLSLDAEVGVTGTKLYDGKLVLSFFARMAVRELRLTYADFGLGPDGSSVVDRELVRDIILVLMSLHRPASKRYTPPSAQAMTCVRHVLDVFGALPFHGSTLMLCDTGVDPNEDDLCAIMMVINVYLLVERELSAPFSP